VALVGVVAGAHDRVELRVLARREALCAVGRAPALGVVLAGQAGAPTAREVPVWSGAGDADAAGGLAQSVGLLAALLALAVQQLVRARLQPEERVVGLHVDAAVGARLRRRRRRGRRRRLRVRRRRRPGRWRRRRADDAADALKVRVDVVVVAPLGMVITPDPHMDDDRPRDVDGERVGVSVRRARQQVFTARSAGVVRALGRVHDPSLRARIPRATEGNALEPVEDLHVEHGGAGEVHVGPAPRLPGEHRQPARGEPVVAAVDRVVLRVPAHREGDEAILGGAILGAPAFGVVLAGQAGPPTAREDPARRGARVADNALVRPGAAVLHVHVEDAVLARAVAVLLDAHLEDVAGGAQAAAAPRAHRHVHLVVDVLPRHGLVARVHAHAALHQRVRPLSDALLVLAHRATHARGARLRLPMVLVRAVQQPHDGVVAVEARGDVAHPGRAAVTARAQPAPLADRVRSMRHAVDQR